MSAAPDRRSAAAQELLVRRQARNSIERYIAYLDPGFSPAAHHKLLIEHLEALDEGEIERLLILMPPGSAKSTYASVLFPAWYLGRHPEGSVIAASHTQDLADRFGRRVRNLVASEAHRNVFGGVGVAADRQAAGQWETEKGGEYYAAGVGGSITGRRADLGIIDDPVRGREDADSERSRETTWQWYVNDFLPRLKPGARQVLIMTRWHQDDLGAGFWSVRRSVGASSSWRWKRYRVIRWDASRVRGCGPSGFRRKWSRPPNAIRAPGTRSTSKRQLSKRVITSNWTGLFRLYGYRRMSRTMGRATMP
jgi:hypothetical protein